MVEVLRHKVQCQLNSLWTRTLREMRTRPICRLSSSPWCQCNKLLIRAKMHFSSIIRSFRIRRIWTWVMYHRGWFKVIKKLHTTKESSWSRKTKRLRQQMVKFPSTLPTRLFKQTLNWQIYPVANSISCNNSSRSNMIIHYCPDTFPQPTWWKETVKTNQ